MQVTKAINIDLIEKSVKPLIYAKQNDSQTRFIAASLFANGHPFSVPDGVVAMFRAGKPDGTACFYDSNETGTPAITIEGNLVTVELAEQVLTAAGKVYAEINLYSSDGEKLTTFSFVIIVEPSVLTDAEIVSSDYYNILSAQIKAAQDAAQTAQTAAQKAQSYAGQAEETLQEVEQLADTVSGTIQQTGQEQVAAVQQAGQTQVSSVTQAGQEQITAVQQAGAQQTAAAAAEANRAKGYADSINPSQFVKTVNGKEPDSNGNVEVQAGVASVFGRTGAVTAQEGDYDAGQIEETTSRVFVSPQEKAKWNGIPGENLVINGGMQIWQRGESLTGVGMNTYTADRLYMHATAGGTFTVERYNDPEMGLCAKITCTAAGWINLGTMVELVGVFPALTGSFYAKCSRNFGNWTIISATKYDDDEKKQVNTIGTSWQRVVFALSNVTANEKLYFTCLRGSDAKAGDVFYLTGIKLEAGGQATPFVPRPYAEELSLCQRYYWVMSVTDGGSSNNPQIATGITGASGYAYFGVHLPTNMRANPTILHSDLSGFDVYNGTHNPPTRIFYYGSTDQKKDITLQIKISASTTAGGMAVLQFWQTVGKAYLALDAEIY